MCISVSQEVDGSEIAFSFLVNCDTITKQVGGCRDNV